MIKEPGDEANKNLVAYPFYLICSGVDGSQLPLVIEHLLKVRNMPELVSRVAMEPLSKSVTVIVMM